MAYIGREPQIGNYQICDAISVVNGQAAYTMQVSSVNVIPESVNHMIVSLNGVIQKPGSSYTISSSTITFSSNLATGDSIDFIYLLGNVLDLGTPSDSTVTTAKLSGNLVTPGTLDVNGQELILDADADTSITADTDDQIDIKVAGADDFRITANTFTALSGSGIVIPDGGLTLGSTAVSSTAAELNILDGVTATASELNLLDGGTSVGGSITLADADGIVVNDGGTMKTIPASDIKTYNPGFSTLGASSVYLPGDIAISGDGYLTQSGAGSALGIYNATASGTGIVTSTTSGHITLDKTGFYLIIYQMNANASSSRDEFNMYIRTWNGSSESNIGYSYLSPDNGSNPTVEGTCVAIVDVDNVSNVKFHMGYQGASNITLRGTGQSVTAMHFIRLGDT